EVTGHQLAGRGVDKPDIDAAFGRNDSFGVVHCTRAGKVAKLREPKGIALLFFLHPQVGDLSKQEIIDATNLALLGQLARLDDPFEVLLVQELLELSAFDHFEAIGLVEQRGHLIGGEAVQITIVREAPGRRHSKGWHAHLRMIDARWSWWV